MAEFKHIQDSSSDSQSNFYCILKEDTNTRPSRTRKVTHQYSKLTEVENEVANLTSSVALLSSNHQDLMKHQYSKQTEVEKEVANLTSSVALLSSNQQDLMKHQYSKQTEVEKEVANLTSSVALLSSNQQDLMKHQYSKLTEVENEVANLTSSLALLSSNQQDLMKHQYSKLTEEENKVANLTSSLALLSSNQQDLMKHQYSKLTEVENEVANLTSSLALLSSNQQDIHDRFMEMLGELKADLESRITNLTRHKPLLSCKAGWQLFLSNCYKFSSDEKNWQTARSSCSGQGALLLILGKDSREWDFIVQHAVQSSKSYWIGLTDAITANWRWVDGTPYTMNSSQWEPGEPNNSMGNEDCGELTKSGKLNDARCSRNFNFICKAPASEN
ncbi:C-type lectin domain family 4 member M [Labeo rohita]|uniref:C-type lectin domain family 4 member M n=1 Tax=Labeo rohita TaxID=84645 RepID=A0ABQ8MNV7_LABRO|nr:C-type lectin domain family 4 member M [Labeo rohita]